MIPKIIHYCWFGGNPLPQKAKKCINSWRKYCPNFKIVEWNESNFNIDLNDYTRFTYEKHLYAYLSDYVRLYVVEKYGGYYFDIDVELLKSPLGIISTYHCDGFLGFEDNRFVNTGLGFASTPNNEAIKSMLEVYHSIKTEDMISRYNLNKNLTGSPMNNTIGLESIGLVPNGQLQMVAGIVILPKDYLCPLNDSTGLLSISENTYSIHWFSKLSGSRISRIKRFFARIRNRIKIR